MAEKIAAVVILYHPSLDAADNIKSYYDSVEKIFVFDNTESEPKVKDELLKLPKVEYFHDRTNEGIAKRLNEGAAMAIQQQFDWILTMDQDSKFSGKAIKSYINCFFEFKNKKNIAMFGTNYGRKKQSSQTECNCVETEDLITSGMLLNLLSFKEVGAFDEALFIDSVDHDYCLRVKTAGWKIFKFNNIYISHELGKQVHKSSVKTLFVVKKLKGIHSALRLYYMYRNMLYLEKKHKNINIKFLKTIRQLVITHIWRCIFYGRNTTEIIKYLIAGYRDFKRGKMGKIEKEL